MQTLLLEFQEKMYTHAVSDAHLLFLHVLSLWLLLTHCSLSNCWNLLNDLSQQGQESYFFVQNANSWPFFLTECTHFWALEPSTGHT